MFPLLTALALQHVTAAHSIVFIGLLPLSTAVFGVLRGAERPKPAFWLFSALGSALVVCFALAQGLTASPAGDLLMLTRALVLSLPIMTALSLLTLPPTFSGITLPTWLSLAYVSVFSMLVGFVFWYRGLAQGGIAAIGQLQLLQPFFGLALAATLLHEPVTWTMLLVSGAIVLCVFSARRFAR